MQENYAILLKTFNSLDEKDWTGETAIFATTGWRSMMDRSGNRWCEDSSNHNGEWPVYLLLDKHPSSKKINNSRETNKISIQTSKSTVNLDNALGEKSFVSSHNGNNLFEIKLSEIPSESGEDFIWSINDKFQENQKKDNGNLTEVRLNEPALALGRGWESVDENGTLRSLQLCRNQRVASVIPVEARPFNKDAFNSYRKSKYNTAMQELLADDGTQYEEDLLVLLNLLKNKYPFHDETNKNILYDFEIRRFAEFYNITDFCPVLSCYDLIFWLKDLNGIIYMWSRIDESMILGGCNMKEALINFLFYQKNLYYIEEYTHELISVKKLKEEVDKCYEKGAIINNQKLCEYSKLHIKMP
ncbi:hypothetical protein C1645_741788 [Glomus cerebriforme]|uniref:Uncharacterized protein n=1 Tax=Glomus cerebriforme TaxID=658196 RepID=A0A397SM71_9GLOM|nr:hypothetical protein C1645_741788 [Glomus cerebriforme]